MVIKINVELVLCNDENNCIFFLLTKLKKSSHEEQTLKGCLTWPPNRAFTNTTLEATTPFSSN
jgi:hypothetical protein